MASFTAELHVGGYVIPLIRCTYGTHQEIDPRGRPITKVRRSNLDNEADVPHHQVLDHWAHEALLRQEAFIYVRDANTGRVLETLHLKAAYCTRYAEQFVSGDVGGGAYRCVFTLADPDGWVWQAGAPANAAATQPAAREHGAARPIVAATRVATGAANVIKLSGGAKGGWTKALNGDLIPNTAYEVDGISYDTDTHGRVERTRVPSLKIKPRNRNAYQQGKSVDLKDGQPGDQGGHIVAARLGGPGEQINYHPMKGNLNQGAWKKMENDWAKSIQNGQSVTNVDIKAVFQGDSRRPDGFLVNYLVDSKKYSRTFVN